MALPDSRPRETLAVAIVTLLNTVLHFCALASLMLGLLGSWLVLLVIALLPVARFLSTLVHEIGHAIGAVAVGWRPVVVTAWPAAIHLFARRLVISDRVKPTDAGGYVFAFPGAPSRDTNLRFTVFALAGPVASLLAAILSAYIAIRIFGPEPAGSFPSAPRTVSFFNAEGFRILFGFSLASCFENLASFLITIVPATYRGKRNDAGLIIDRLRNPDRNTSWNSWIVSVLFYNVRLRTVPEWMYASARKYAFRENSEPSWLDGLDISRGLDAMQVDASGVRRDIEAYRAAYGDNNWLLNCDAWLAAIYENDVARAEESLALRKTGEADSKLMYAAAEGAVAARRGQHELVTRKLWWLDQELRADSPFPNATFHDIRMQIEAIAASTPSATATA